MDGEEVFEFHDKLTEAVVVFFVTCVNGREIIFVSVRG